MQISTRGIVNLCLPCVVSRNYNQYLICIYRYVIGNEKKQILELFDMKLSKTIDQTRICKKSYDDPLGYFCIGFFLLVPMDKWPGFDIDGCPIAQGKWNASSGKWKRHPTCLIGQVKMILWYVQFLKSKMINIELFSVGSRGEFSLNIARMYRVFCHFVLFCWLRNSPFSNKDCVIYISQS
jgi:hypothetical protein